MNLIICGILSTAAILYCVLFNETLMFNMMMCVFCLLAIVSLWSDKPQSQAEGSEETASASEQVNQEKQK